MNAAAIIQLLNTLLPVGLKVYKEYRDANPDQPSLTDAQIVDLLSGEADAIVGKAETWLAAHPASK